jgi:hypothetical protein
MTSDSFESPLEPFESPKELINGVKERIAELKSICDSVRETRDYEVITDNDPKTRDKIVKLRLKQRFPTKIRRLTSSVLKELKTALDQAFSESALMLGRKHARGIYFPFGKDVEDLERSVKRNCEGVDVGLIEFCLLFKPYHGIDGNKVLWSMSKMAGTTHETIVGVGFEDTTSFVEAITLATGGMKLIINKWNELHNEIEVARVPPGGELHVKNDFTLRFEIVFSKRAHALRFCPLIPSLYDLSGIVEVIVAGIEAQTARILRERSCKDSREEGQSA